MLTIYSCVFSSLHYRAKCCWLYISVFSFYSWHSKRLVVDFCLLLVHYFFELTASVPVIHVSDSKDSTSKFSVHLSKVYVHLTDSIQSFNLQLHMGKFISSHFCQTPYYLLGMYEPLHAFRSRNKTSFSISYNTHQFQLIPVVSSTKLIPATLFQSIN